VKAHHAPGFFFADGAKATSGINFSLANHRPNSALAWAGVGTAMNIWIVGSIAAFYANLIAQLGFEMWRARRARES
jgi:hypothetical protein